MASKKKAPPVDVDAFFSRTVPRLLGAMRALCAERGGRYGVVVDGRAFTIDFAQAAVVAGADNVDVTVTLSAAQFQSLAAGTELRKLVASGEAALSGDRDRIEDLSLVLAFLAR